MRKLALTIILFAIFFQLSTSSLQASFGISPAEITYEYLRPGTSIEKEFLLSRSTADYPARIEIEKHVEGANDWIKIEPGNEFEFSQGERTKSMKVIISPPEDVRYRSFTGYIIVKIHEGSQTTGVAVVKGLGITVDLNTTWVDYVRLLVRELRIPDLFEKDPLMLIIKAQNQGNQSATLDRVEIKVLDTLENEEFTAVHEDFELVEPSITKELAINFENDLTSGEYQADIKVFYQDQIKEDSLFFNVLEQEVVIDPDDIEPDVVYQKYFQAVLLLILIVLVLLVVKKNRRKN